MVEESSPLLPPAEESIEADTDTALEPEAESGERATEPLGELGFDCDCERGMRSACIGLAFYKEHESRRYCVLHYPGKEKSADFKAAFESKLNSEDFNFRGVWFPDEVDFRSFEFSAASYFTSATFSAAAYFASARFSAHANFRAATFSADAEFSFATFSGPAYFRSARFSTVAEFSEATFSAAAEFSEATFSAPAIFRSATFSAEAEFNSASFSAGAYFNSASFSAGAYFSSASFSVDADFGFATFIMAAHFSSAMFGAYAGFSDATFKADASFVKAAFNSEAQFREATFNADADFKEATFRTDGDFSKATFGANACFSDATFGSAYFSETAFSEADFKFSVFHDMADFSGTIFNDYVHFFGNAKERQLKDGTSLEPMALGKDPSLDFQHVRIERPGRIAFHTLKLLPHWFVNVDSRQFVLTDVRWEWDRISIKDEIAALEARDVSSPSRLLAIACRQLAENAEANNRYEEASRFRYWAMDLARRTKWKGWSFWKTDWLHMLYWAVSGYGERILRALGVLAAVWIVFVLLYTRVGFVPLPPKPTNDGESSMMAAIVSVQQGTGQPLEFSRALTYSLAVMSLQKPEPKPLTGTAQTLVLLETILGPVQAALLALAIRRKFMR